ncbi:MAG: hypothetical protein PUE12_17800 [Oscillospiraceae bacterium]|nr:hypothetical protein [Oscillospiraceae bacterium]
MTYEEMLIEFQLMTQEFDNEEDVKSFGLLIDAIKKQIPKKIVKGNDPFWEYQCPNTNCDTQFASHASYEHCPCCGQAIDWGEDK